MGIEAISITQEIVDPNTEGEARVYGFHSSNTHLDLTVYPATGEAFTNVEDLPRDRRVIDDINALSSLVRDELQDLANTENRTICYLFTAPDYLLDSWALGDGERIFRWDSFERYGDTLYAQRLFKETP